ncbi:multiubiquitin domain-containing protein [Kitasatospora sp. NPDC058444]|uniref:multiubiquitin domain-containing protein n=1 Tax=Kitasatospora sp. NPDC058444 TaxID=3346504 RepID=UPI0036567555
METPIDTTTKTDPHRHVSVTVKVNNQDVTLPDREVTGLEIKQAAISQGLPIDVGFQLSVKRSHGRYEVVDDDEPIRVHTHQEFLAVPPDDNS